MRRVFLSGIYLLLTSAIVAQTAVLNVKDNTQEKDEPVVSYFLPRTVLKVEVEATKTTKKAGPYSAHARKHFGTPAKIQQNEEVWTINSISVRQESEPDTGNQYKVYAATTSNASLLSLTGAGILQGINLPASMLPVNENEKQQPGVGVCRKKENQEETPAWFVSDFIVRHHDEDSVKKSDDAIIFDQILSLRETRLNILLMSNDVLQNGSAVDSYLWEIDKRIAELTALFNGKEQTEIVKKIFTVYPDKELTNKDIFNFSEKQGFSDSGNAITITLKKQPVNKPFFSGKGKTGFVYRIPAPVNVDITGNKTVLWSGTFNVAQLGELAYFPAGFFDKNDIKALFDTKSGALLQVGK